MRIGPKYKIARRLKAPIFEKTQTQKYALREGRKTKSRGSGRPKTDFGIQMSEKQKTKMFYCITERQLAKYVKQALVKKANSPAANLLRLLECRLDNVIWRAGILPTHLSARQAVSHGHFLVNDKRVYVPSFQVAEGYKIAVREGSKTKKLFSELGNKGHEIKELDWFAWNNDKKELLIKKEVAAEKSDLLFDLGQVIEYYQK